jgi:hypothetical protein
MHLTGAFDGALSFTPLTGVPVRIAVDASVGRSDDEQLASHFGIAAQSAD